MNFVVNVAIPRKLADKGSHFQLNVELHDVGYRVKLDVNHWVRQEHESNENGLEINCENHWTPRKKMRNWVVALRP